MKKLRLAALAVECVTLLVRLYPSLPDWTIRLNGVIMLAGAGALAFAGMRPAREQKKEN